VFSASSLPAYEDGSALLVSLPAFPKTHLAMKNAERRGSM